MAQCCGLFSSLIDLRLRLDADLPWAIVEPRSVRLEFSSSLSTIGRLRAAQPISASALSLENSHPFSTPGRSVVFKLAVRDFETDYDSLTTLASVTRVFATVLDTRTSSSVSEDPALFAVIAAEDCRSVDIHVPIPSDISCGASVEIHKVTVAGSIVGLTETPVCGRFLPTSGNIKRVRSQRLSTLIACRLKFTCP
jgi:hypothetical protein